MTKRTVALLGVFAVPAVLSAQTPPKAREFTTDLGFVATSGNTDVRTFNLGEKLILRRGRVESKQQFGSVYGSQDGKQTSNLLFVNWRSEFAFSKNVAAFGYAGFDRNQFAGISRRFEQAVGLAAKLITTDAGLVTFEAGLALNQQRSTTGADLNFSSARTGTYLRRNFSKDSYFFQSIEYLPSFKVSSDYRVNTESGLVAPISTHISMKIGYVVRYDNLPEVGRKKEDQILTTGLQFNW